MKAIQICSRTGRWVVPLIVALAASMDFSYGESYPDMQAAYTPVEAYDARFSSFSTALIDASADIAADSPQIAEWTRQGEPGEAIVLTGENLTLMSGEAEGRDSHFAVLSANGLSRNAPIQRLDGYQCTIALPDDLPPNEVYLLYPRNAAGYGEPVAINRAEAWWIGPTTVRIGQRFSVYGQNLSLGGSCLLYIDGYGIIESVSANPYKADFELPAGISIGNHAVHAHNGHGRQYGWSEGLTLQVAAASQWNDNPGTWKNVKSYGAVGDGVADDFAAINSAINAAGQWGTVYFPAGTYAMGTHIKKMGTSNLRFVGEGQHASKLTCWSGYVANDSVRALLEFYGGGNIVFKDMALSVNSSGFVYYTGSYKLYLFTAVNGMHFDNVKISSLDAGKLAELMEFDQCSNVRFSDCTFEISRPITSKNTCDGFAFENCDFYGIHDANNLLGGTGSMNRFSVSGCTVRHYDTSDASEGEGWGKGRFVGYAESSYFYYGDNQVVDYQPRITTPFWSGGTITSIGAFGSNYTHTGVGSLGAVRDVTFTFADIPDRFDGRGDNSIDYAGATASLPIAPNDANTSDDVIDGWVKELDAINNTLTLRVKENQWAKIGRVTPAYTTTATLKDKVDQNAGEMILFEHGVGVGGALYRGSPTGATATTTTFPAGVNTGGSGMIIVSGRGAGQYSRISSWSGTTALGETAWRVVPDSSSVIVIGDWVNHVAVYNSSFDAQNPQINTASTSLQMTGGGHKFVMDSCTVSDSETGISIYADGFENQHPGINYISPNYFYLYKNNTIRNTKYAIRIDYDLRPGTTDPYLEDPIMMGLVYRKNTLLNNDYAIIYAFNGNVSSPDLKHYASCVFDQNAAVGTSVNFLTDDEVDDQLMIRNTFSGTSPRAFEFGSGQVPYLLGNTMNGYSTPYSGGLQGPVLEVPVRRHIATAENPAVTVPLYNCGTASMSWTVIPDGSPWISVPTATGTLAAQSRQGSFQVVVNPALAPASGEAVLTVQAAGRTQQVTLVYKADASGTQKVLVDLSVEGPEIVMANRSVVYRCWGLYNDGSSNRVDSAWSVRTPSGAADGNASIDTFGNLSIGAVAASGTHVLVRAEFGGLQLERAVTLLMPGEYHINYPLNTFAGRRIQVEMRDGSSGETLWMQEFEAAPDTIVIRDDPDAWNKLIIRSYNDSTGAWEEELNTPWRGTM